MLERRRLGGTLLAGAAMVSALLLVALAAPRLAPYDPAEQLDPAAGQYRPPGTVLAAVRLVDGGWRLADRIERTPEGLRLERLGRTEILPAAKVRNLTPRGVAARRVFLLGSDKFGRDLLSRVLYGARVSLGVGILSVALALTLGVAVGSAAALGGPVLDAVLMRSVDALLAFPSLFLLIALAAFLTPGTLVIILILGGLSWMTISRLARAEVLVLKSREFVLAARAMGQRPVAILFKHLLPNAFTPVLIQAMLLVGQLILVESSLSFLGLGIQPPTPSWGNMISDGREALGQAWWVTVFPGAAIALAVIAFTLLGDGLRDALDPRRYGRTLPAVPEVPADPGATLPPS
jgi:peptide/nickel transport system permease protein